MSSRRRPTAPADPIPWGRVGALALLGVALVAGGCKSCADPPAPTPAPGSGLGNLTIPSFRAAKKLVYGMGVHHPRTFYCACAYQGKTPDHGSCGYQLQGRPKRASRIEVEHVVPAHAFGQSFAAWRKGDPACVNSKGKPYKGRRCAGKISAEFRRMEADLYNLRPVVGEINAERSNYSMAMIPGESRRFGPCDLEISGRKIEPRPEIRGDIARTYLYMDKAYPGRGIVGKKRRKLFAAWSAADPVDDAERAWARAVEKAQGNPNPFVVGGAVPPAKGR